jgi:putative PEP-CTERM system TPR-repeat lipoprotein
MSLLVACAALSLAVGCSDSESPEQLVASAKSYLDQRDTQAALIQLKRALAVAPESAEVRLLFGRALLASGDPVAAELELRKAKLNGAPDEAVLPELARALLLLAQPDKVTGEFGRTVLQQATAQADLRTTVAAAFAQRGNLLMANEAIESALQEVPGYPPAMMVQARMKADAGDVDGALAQLATVLRNDPGNEQAGVAKGYLLWTGKGDAAAALQAHRQVLATAPGSVPAQAEIVTLLFREGRTAEAREAFEALRKLAPTHPQTLFFDAQFAYLDRDYKRSRELTDVLLSAMPTHIRALELAGAAEYQLGNDTLAQGLLARALKVNPGLVLSRQIMAQSFLRADEPSKAIEILSPLIQLEDATALSLALAGNAYALSGDFKRADAAFKRASQIAPENATVRTMAAVANFSSGRADIALRELEAVAAGDQETRADMALISARIAKSDAPGALKAIDGLTAKLPGQPLPDQLRGQVLLATRDAAGARRSFEAALAKDARYFPAIAALASMDTVLREHEAAKKRVLDYIQAVPNDATAHLLLAEIAASSGAAPAEVVQHLEDAVRADPTDAEAHLALIRRQLAARNAAAALSAAQAGAAALPQDQRLQEALGQTQLMTGDVRQASVTWNKLVAQRPDDARLQLGLAEVHLATKDYGAAETALKRASELDPDLLEARRSLALLALQQGRPQQAIAMARDMQKRQPKAALGYATEGDVAVRSREWGPAAAAYRQALRHGPASETAMKLHATLRAAGKQSDADRVAGDWEKARPNDPLFRFYLGDTAMQQKDFARAETHYRAVLVSDPGNALALNNVADTLLRQSKPGALEIARRASELMPNAAPILDTLAAAQAGAGRLPDAITTQRQAIAASPQDPGLKLGLARYLVAAGQREEAREQLLSLERLGQEFGQQAEVSALLKSL